MEDGFKTKLPTVMFRGTPCMITEFEREVHVQNYLFG